MDIAGKIRASRAYLQWSQEKLARESGMSLQGIQKIEYGETKPTLRTQEKIARALHKRGVSFSSRGIEFDENPIFMVEGKTHEETYLKLLEDAYEHLMTFDPNKRELLIMYADDKVSPPSVNNMYRQMRADNIRMRQMVQEGNEYIMGPLNEYRYIPKKLFINRVTLVYGERIAHETANVLRACIRVDTINADIQRNTFNILWSVLKQPTVTIADDKF